MLRGCTMVEENISNVMNLKSYCLFHLVLHNRKCATIFALRDKNTSVLCFRIAASAIHTLEELMYVCSAGIGPQLCHSSSKYSQTSSVLLSWCSLGRGRGMDLFCVSRWSSLSLLLSTCPWLTEPRRDQEEAAHLILPLASFCLCLYVFF